MQIVPITIIQEIINTLCRLTMITMVATRGSNQVSGRVAECSTLER